MAGPAPVMNLDFSPETLAFQAEVRAFLAASLPEDIRCAVEAERMDLGREMLSRWQGILFDKGWASPNWPTEHGGLGWSDEQQYVFERELAFAGAPRPDSYAIVMLGPTLIRFGGTAQKRRFLPGMARGTTRWCQGFSEPNAGSDLAALRTRAVRDGDHYVVDGSKIWTSEAHEADWLFGLFRTDSTGPKQHGISFLLIDMSAPGVKVEPLLTFENTHEVNQVFFDGVRVPVDNRVGEENQGWAIAKHLLGLERFGTAEVARSLASLGRLKRLASETPAAGATLLDMPEFANQIAILEIELRALEVTEQRFLFGPGGADALGPEASLLKVRGTEIQQRILELGHRALGAYAAVDGHGMIAPLNAPVAGLPAATGHAAKAHFNFRKTAIYSGTNEIQRNILAKAILGL